jgi:hypothetical protein
MEAALPRQRKKDPRISRPTRRAAEPPQVPVVVPDTSTSTEAEPPPGRSQSTAQPDPLDDQIRRMIEAAYT